MLATLVALRKSVYIGWPRLIATLILIILFIPIRRYALPGSLPFQLEPYRIFVAVLAMVGARRSSSTGGRKVRRNGFEGPMLVIVASAFASVVANPGRVATTSTEVNKSLMFLLSFVLVLYLLSSMIRRLDNVDYLAKTLVAGGAIVAFFAVVEARTGFNVFNHLSKVMPFLRDTGDVGGYQRLGTDKTRVFASAQHPIALSAALVILLPLAIYLARRYSQRRWYASRARVGDRRWRRPISRTGIVMLVVVAVVFLCLRPRETRRFWPALFPAPLAIHFVLPGTLGAIKQSFLPDRAASWPSSKRVRTRAVAGGLPTSGRRWRFGRSSRCSARDTARRSSTSTPAGVQANIFDDQWLGTLLETGVIGFCGWIWLFVRAHTQVRPRVQDATSPSEGGCSPRSPQHRGVRGRNAHLRRVLRSSR